MCASCEEWSDARHDPNWKRRHRRALKGYMKVPLPGDRLIPRDSRGRFARATNV